MYFRYQTNLSKDILDTIMSIQPKDSAGGGGETRESVVYKLATDMLSKLPVDYLPHEVHVHVIIVLKEKDLKNKYLRWCFCILLIMLSCQWHIGANICHYKDDKVFNLSI